MTKEATQSNEPIVLDDSGVEEGYISKKPANGAVKLIENIEIDLSDDEEKETEEKASCGAKTRRFAIAVLGVAASSFSFHYFHFHCVSNCAVRGPQKMGLVPLF